MRLVPQFLPKEVVKAQRQQANQGKSVGWAELLDHWLLIELDLLETYGVDVWDPALRRPWPWWRDRILSLLSAGGRLAKALGH